VRACRWAAPGAPPPLAGAGAQGVPPWGLHVLLLLLLLVVLLVLLLLVVLLVLVVLLLLVCARVVGHEDAACHTSWGKEQTGQADEFPMETSQRPGGPT